MSNQTQEHLALIPEDSGCMLLGRDYTANEDGVIRFRTYAEILTIKILQALAVIAGTVALGWLIASCLLTGLAYIFPLY